MKLVADDDKDTSCNGNGILDDQIKKMISSDPPKVSSNGDVHNDDSRSNSDSLNGSGDLLIEDPNTVRNGSDDTPFLNGSKPDDTRSWSSNSSNFPPPDIDEDLSDEMTLRLSDEEDESENTPESTQSKKDSIQHTSSPLPMAEQNTLSDKNQITTLVKDDTESNTQQKPSDNVSNKVDETNKSPELESLITEIMPDTSIIDTDNDKSVTELREEMEELLNDEDSEDKVQIVEKNNSVNNKDKVLSDIELNSSTSTIKKSFSNEESSCSSTTNVSLSNHDDSCDLNKETEIDSTLLIKEKDQEPTCKNSKENEDTVTKTNENKGMKEINDDDDNDDNNKESKEKTTDDDSFNNDQMETEEISVDTSKLGKNVEESNIENNEESNKDVVADSTKNSEEPSTVDKSVSVKEISDSVSSDNISEEIQTNTEATVDDDSKTNLKDSEVNIENREKQSIDETNAISEPMEILVENSKEKIVDQLESSTNISNVRPNDSEPMEIDSNDIGKNTDATNNTIVEAPITSESTAEINEDIKSVSLIDISSKDNIQILKENEEIKSESEGKVDIIEEDIKGTKDEESSKCLKRSLETDVNEIDAKKPKIEVKPREKREYVPMNYLRDFLSKKEIKSMSREELEEFCVQKMCESINQTSKVGELNRLVKQQEQVIESLRTKYNGLKKQIGDISIVQNKMLQEVRAAKGKDGGSVNVMPVKITRSVGLQVSLQPSNRIRPILSSPEQLVAAPLQKRKLQRISLPNKLPNAQTPVTPITPAKPVSATIPKSPNTISTPTPASGPCSASTPVSTANKIVKTILPRTYNGPDTNKDVSSSTNSLLSNYLTNPSPKPSTPIVVRKTMTSTNAVSSSATTATATSTKVIDLTDEDDVSKIASAIPSTPAGIRVVAPHQLNNTSTPVTSQMQRVAYLVSPGQQGQVLLATTSAPTRPGGPRSTIMFKPVQQGQVPNGQRLNFVRPHSSSGTVTVVPATSTASIRPGQQIRFQSSGTTVNSVRPQMISSTRITPTQRHPAPLPGPPAVQPSQPTWKAMPPKPSLKISKVGDGIVLSWKMLNKDMSLYEDIASYQLYAYQETNALPSTDMWRKVGDVKALALPMACTLTQFTDGNKYHFAVRAVDVKSRVGPFSQPEQIALP